MSRINFARLAAVTTGLTCLLLASADPTFAAANCIKGEHKPPYKLGWATSIRSRRG